MTLDLDVDKLKRLYCNKLSTLESIGRRFNTSRRTIANWLIRAGVKRRSFHNRYNAKRNARIVDYLSDWKNQTPYIVGYIFADGSIDVLNPKSPGVSFCCAEKDAEILLGIAHEFGLGNCLIKYPAKEIGGPQVRFRIFSKTIVAVLDEYGIKPRKTWLNYGLPDLPPIHLHHFIRGAFDGDGWVSKTKSGKSFGFLGPEKFVTEIRDELIENIGVNLVKVQKRPGHYAVAWQSSKAASLVYPFLYPEGEYLHLRRKRKLLFEVAEC